MTEQQFCVNCGQTVDALDKFCATCGAAQAASDGSAVARTVTAPPVFAAPATQPPQAITARPGPATEALAAPGTQHAPDPRVRWSGVDWAVVLLAVVLAVALLAVPWFKFSSLTAVEAPNGWTGVVGVVAAAVVIASVVFGRGTPGARSTGCIASVAAVAAVALKYCVPQLEFGSELQFSSVVLDAYSAGFWLALVAAVALVLMSTVRLFQARQAW